MGKPLYDIVKGVPGVDCATREDEAELFALLMLMHNEMALFSVAPEKVVDSIKLGTEQKGGIIWVVRHDRRIVGSIGLFLGQDWYTNDDSFFERWHYVHPDFRKGTDYARRLIDQLKWTAEQFKTPERTVPIQFGINALHRTESKIRLYARNFVCIGAYFLVGDVPRKTQNQKLQAEIAEIEKMNREISHRKRDRFDMRPAAKEIIRASRSHWG